MRIYSTSPRDQAAVEALLAAINAGDKAGFLATLHPDIVYTFHHKGYAPAHGEEAVAQVWDAMTASFAGLHEEITRLYVRPGHAIAQWTLSAGLSGA